LKVRSDEQAHRAVEAVARESYGRLVALLATRTHDVAGAEDALGDALLAKEQPIMELSAKIDQINGILLDMKA